MTSQFAQLRAVLNASLDAFEDEFNKEKLPPLNLDDPGLHAFEDPTYLPSPRLWESRRLLISSLGMMRALVSCGVDRAFELVYQPCETAAVEVVVNANVASILAADDVDPNVGLHKDELGKRAGLQPDKLARVLRLLAAHHVFRETAPNTFANNRLSVLFKTGTPAWHLARPLCRYNTPASSKLWEVLSDKEWGPSFDVDKTAFNKSFGPTFWFDFLAQDPERFTDFAIGMEGYGNPTVAGSLADYPWEALGKRTIVDVAGGQGSFSLQLLKTYPDLKLILQDRPEVIEVGKKNFAAHFPESLQGEPRVKFEPYDIFTPQPNQGDEFIFFLRWIAHDWPDAQLVKILTNIRNAMGPTSKLILCEPVVDYGVPTPSDAPSAAASLAALDSKDYKPVPLPAPLPNNGGEYARTTLLLDHLMLNFVNAHERTEAQFAEVLSKAGLKLERTYRVRSAKTSIIEAVPA